MVLLPIHSLMPTVSTSSSDLSPAGLPTLCNNFVPDEYSGGVVKLNKLIQDLREGGELGLVPMDVILHDGSRRSVGFSLILTKEIQERQT
jgi:hypothetical protein